MNRKRTIVGLLAASVALLGVLAYLLADGGGSGARSPAEKAGSRKGAAGKWPGDSSFEAVAGGGNASLTPEQEAMVRSALEKLGNETAIRAAFTAGVAEPWPLPAAQKQFESCIPTIERGLPRESVQVPADICACATRGIQAAYPREPPQLANSRERRMYGERLRAAVDECMNPQ